MSLRVTPRLDRTAFTFAKAVAQFGKKLIQQIPMHCQVYVLNRLRKIYTTGFPKRKWVMLQRYTGAPTSMLCRQSSSEGAPGLPPQCGPRLGIAIAQEAQKGLWELQGEGGVCREMCSRRSSGECQWKRCSFGGRGRPQLTMGWAKTSVIPAPGLTDDRAPASHKRRTNPRGPPGRRTARPHNEGTSTRSLYLQRNEPCHRGNRALSRISHIMSRTAPRS